MKVKFKVDEQFAKILRNKASFRVLILLKIYFFGYCLVLSISRIVMINLFNQKSSLLIRNKSLNRKSRKMGGKNKRKKAKEEVNNRFIILLACVHKGTHNLPSI